MRTQRLRDPVHGLIVFSKDDPIECLAWQLIDTPEFQRLRRIKQLGVSEFVYPGATHTRFAHCIGVFHVARGLIKVIDREIRDIKQTYDKKRAEVAVIAALLHDLGHGPCSHTFEDVLKKQNIHKRHEKWTAEIILNPQGKIKPLLDSYWPDGTFTQAVAGLLDTEDPRDIYHAVVSSSFDADRLDYLRRDRLMTGTGAGAIDFDWLMEHVRVAYVNLEAADIDPTVDNHGGNGPRTPTFCIDRKALPAAEQFLLSRYTLHEQVYFHKTTRCIEHMISDLLQKVAAYAKQPDIAPRKTGLDPAHPLLRFFAENGGTLENYHALDDVILWSGIERMITAEDSTLADMAKRLRDRCLYKTLDIREFGLDDKGRQASMARRIDKKLADNGFSGTVLKDGGASLSIYTEIGGDDEKAHKKLRILDGDGHPREISRLSRIVESLSGKKILTRYYFERESDRELARHLPSTVGGTHGT